MKEEPESDTEMDHDGGAEEAADRRGGNTIVLDGTSEFCRSLGDIPTYGQAGNRADEDDELLVSGNYNTF